MLTLHYKDGDNNLVIPVTSEEYKFVSTNLSTGAFRSEFGGAAEVEVTSVWTMGGSKPGKKGITGKGHLGHAFPRIAPHEVDLFNELEIHRIEGRSSESIERFNLRMDPMTIQVYFETP